MHAPWRLVACLLVVSVVPAAATSYSLLPLLPSGGAYRFGWATGMLGQDAVVGAFLTTRDYSGSVHVFEGGSGALLRTIPSPHPTTDDVFGSQLAVVGTTLLVGAPAENSTAPGAGAAYLFDAATGQRLRTFTSPNDGTGGFFSGSFGRSVAGGGGILVVGALGDDVGAPDAGAAYVFDAITGVLRATLSKPVPGASDGLGSSVAVAGSVIAVAERHGGLSGAVHLFDAATGAWLQALTNPSGAPGAFGWRALAADGTQVLVGALGDAAYLFDATSGALLQTFPRTSVPTGSSLFADAVAFVGSDVLVGDPGDGPGRIARFDRTTGALLETIPAPGPPWVPSYFGNDLASSGGTILAGSFFDRSANGIDEQGAAYLLQPCGDGVRGGAEQCDDGNTMDGDGCSAACRLELCPPAPAFGCRRPTQSGRASLKLKNAFLRDTLAWRWLAGAETQTAEFGDPTTSSSPTLCLYDASASPQPLLALAAPAGSPCGGKPCWKATGTGFRYRDRYATPDGLIALGLVAGGDGAARIVAKGKGRLLPLPNGPWTPPVVVQLHATGTPVCWEAVYSSPSLNDFGTLKARAD